MNKVLSIMGARLMRQITLAERTGISIWWLNRCLKHPSLYQFRKEEKEKIIRALCLPDDVDRKKLFGEDA
ncbi:hypothetical protein ANRL1_01412 [Anaerolineae bacterium]|nr:hypothetical protein ANRL1_01412 [Anaerolineae bacterium]